MLAGGDAGYISLDLDFDPSPVKGPRADRSRAAVADVTKSDLTLTLTHSSGAISPIVCAYDDFADGNNSRVNTGLYTLEAACGDAEAEGWDQAYFYGSTQLTVKNEQVTEVSLPVRLANSIVNVALSEGFTSYMSDYTVTVTTGSGNVYDWAASADRELYVKPGSVMVSVRFTKPNGMTATADIDPITAEARHRYNVTIDVEAGSAETLNVTFDDTVDEKEVELDISDSNLPMLAAAPKILTDGFQAGDVVTLVEGSAYSTPLKSTIVARGVIASAVLNVNSAYLKSKGWPESIDLANPGASQSLLDSYGVKTLGLTGNKAVFAVADFTALVSKLAYVDGADNTSSFSLTVTDAQGKTETSDLFSVNVEKLVLEILDGSEITDNGKATVIVHYNGGDINDVKIYADNDRGTQTLLTVKNVTPSAQFGIYTLEVEDKVITTEDPVTIRPKTEATFGEAYVLKVPNLRVVAAETNAFASKAYVTLDFMTAELLAKQGDVQFEVSTDGGVTYTSAATALESAARASRVAGAGTAVYLLKGLTPNQSYTFRARLDSEISTTATMTTEEAAQLPERGFDKWTSEKKGDYQYLWKVADGSVWSTLNDLTTSQFGSGSSNGLNCGGAAYKATSGTIPANGRSTKTMSNGGGGGTSKAGDGHTVGNESLHADKGHLGTANAALIRTVGWGSGNASKAAVLFGAKDNAGFGTCDNKTVGELYLGSYQGGTPIYGYSFISRPSALSFYYHYDVVTANNGDFGTVEAFIYDMDGNMLAETKLQKLSECGDYQKVTFPFNYVENAGKAARISVIFKSSGNSEALKENTSFWRTPGHNNISGGEYSGSELYIDDIELIYE